MPPSHRLLAIVATTLAFTACGSSPDQATVQFSLGANRQSLSIDSVTVERFELTMVCVDGVRVSAAGEIGEDGSFEAEVPSCPQAEIRFRGLTGARLPALQGATEATIRPPTTEVALAVRRVGTVTIVNDDTYGSVCAIRAPSAPEFETAFPLSPGEATTVVLPVTGASLACAPADTCGGIAACNFDGPLATTRPLSVAFGGESTVSLANLANSLVFTVGPPGPHDVGTPFGPFTVSLVDELGQPVDRSDVVVSLVAESSTTYGGFANGNVVMVSGVAQFNGVTFTTAGPLLMRAEADVDGVVLRTDTRTIQVIAGPTTQLVLTGAASATAGVPVDLDIAGVDQFGNTTSPPPSLIVDSSDPLASGVVVTTVGGIARTQLTLVTAGRQTITARSSSDSGLTDAYQLDVGPAAAAALEITSGGVNYQFDQIITFNVTARDAYGNVATGYAGTVQLNGDPSSLFTYGGPHAFTATDAGRFAFTGQFGSDALAYTGSVVATDGTLTSLARVLNIVLPGTIDRFEFDVVPSAVVAGDAFSVTLTAVDTIGVPVSGWVDPVDVRAAGCPVQYFDFSVSPTTVTQDVSCSLVGTWNLEVLYGGVVLGTSPPITVSAGSPYVLELVRSPPPVIVANTPFSLIARLRDIAGNTADPRVMTGFTATLMEAVGGAVLSGATPIFVGDMVVFESLTINTATSGSYIDVTVTPSLEVSSFSTNTFDVIAGGCPRAYVRAGATGSDPCDFQNPVGSIQAAIDAVDAGGDVRVAGGDYAGQSVIVNKSLTLLGGYDIAGAFDPLDRRPLERPTRLKGITDSVATVSVSGSASVVAVDGFVIEAPTPAIATTQPWAVSAGPGTILRLENNRITGPLTTLALASGGAVLLDAVTEAVVRDNWIHTGGAGGGTGGGVRHGIKGGNASGNTYLVHNTILVGGSDTAAAVTYGGLGGVSVTNNLILGNFVACGSSSGTCAVREVTGPIASLRNNYVVRANGAGAAIYSRHTAELSPSLNVGGTHQYRGNSGEANAVLAAPFVSFAGPDNLVDTMADNDWHLLGAIAIGLDAAQASCGGDSQTWCGGDRFDIDVDDDGVDMDGLGELRAVPACVGADERVGFGA